MTTVAEPRGSRPRSLRGRWDGWPAGARYAIGAYVATRLLYLAIAAVDIPLRAGSLSAELSNWDGYWYLRTAAHWYPATVPHTYSTLGFLPLYPMLMWLVGHVLPGPGYVLPGVLVALVCGAVAVVLIERLAREWWGEAAARRAILFYCLFPGSIVFSMVYGEGVTLMLVAGSLLCLRRQRWLAAGLLAGAATAVEPIALGMVPVCIYAALRHMHDRGWGDRRGWRALVAPVLSPWGLVAFAVYLWAHVGTPLASYKAQKYAWKETSTPFALWRDAHQFALEVIHYHGGAHPSEINLNLLAAVLGALFLLYGLILLWRARRAVGAEAIIFTLALTVLTVTSNSTPPNARMLTCMFPATLAVGARWTGRAQTRLLAVTLILTVAMSIDTFVATGLRP